MSIDVSRFLIFLRSPRTAQATFRKFCHLDGPRPGTSNSRMFSSDIAPTLRSYSETSHSKLHQRRNSALLGGQGLAKALYAFH